METGLIEDGTVTVLVEEDLMNCTALSFWKRKALREVKVLRKYIVMILTIEAGKAVTDKADNKLQK